MKRFLIFAGIGTAIIVILMAVASHFMKQHTKSFSPEEEVVFNQDDLTIRVTYNRPYKKERDIFGSLVPYNTVWRTGANEATTIETNKALNFGDKTLRPGKYSLWTIPREDSWTIIFNSEYGQWGINSKGEANRNADRDVLTVDAAVTRQEREFEQFTIAFEKVGEDSDMIIMWNKTVVAVPFSKAQ